MATWQQRDATHLLDVMIVKGACQSNNVHTLPLTRPDFIWFEILAQEKKFNWFFFFFADILVCDTISHQNLHHQGEIVTTLHLSFISHTNIKTLVTQLVLFQQHNNTKSSESRPRHSLNCTTKQHCKQTDLTYWNSFDGRVQDLLIILPNGPAHPVQLHSRQGEHADHDDQASDDVVDGRDHPQDNELEEHGHHDLEVLHGAD